MRYLMILALFFLCCCGDGNDESDPCHRSTVRIGDTIHYEHGERLECEYEEFSFVVSEAGRVSFTGYFLLSEEPESVLPIVYLYVMDGGHRIAEMSYLAGIDSYQKFVLLESGRYDLRIYWVGRSVIEIGKIVIDWIPPL